VTHAGGRRAVKLSRISKLPLQSRWHRDGAGDANPATAPTGSISCAATRQRADYQQCAEPAAAEVREA